MIKLIEMYEIEFISYMEAMVFSYASNIAVSRRAKTNDEHTRYAQEKFNEMLPLGYKTKGHVFLSIISNGNKIGNIWLSIQPFSIAFLHDISIDTEHQRKGYGTEALKKVEQFAIGKGCESIALHVFYHNKHAQAFYKKNGSSGPDDIRAQVPISRAACVAAIYTLSGLARTRFSLIPSLHPSTHLWWAEHWHMLIFLQGAKG